MRLVVALSSFVPSLFSPVGNDPGRLHQCNRNRAQSSPNARTISGSGMEGNTTVAVFAIPENRYAITAGKTGPTRGAIRDGRAACGPDTGRGPPRAHRVEADGDLRGTFDCRRHEGTRRAWKSVRNAGRQAPSVADLHHPDRAPATDAAAFVQQRPRPTATRHSHTSIPPCVLPSRPFL